jgi:transposase
MLPNRLWLARLKFDQSVHHIVPEDGIAAIEAATARINWPRGSISMRRGCSDLSLPAIEAL